MKKQIGINLIAQMIAFGVNLGISFFLTPFIVNHIGVEANGFVGLANNFIEYAQLITVALNSMAGRFITIKYHQNDKQGASKYFSSVFFANVILTVIMTLVFTIIIVFLNNIINISQELVFDVKILWMLIFINFIFGIFTSIFSTAAFVKNRLDLSALVNAKGYIIKAIILIICFIIFKPAVWYVGLAISVMGLYVLIKNIIFTKKLTPEIEINKKLFDIKTIKEVTTSGIWNTISKLSSILSSGLDLLITNLFVNGVAMGVLSLSKTIPNIVLSFFGTIATIFAPQLTISYAKNEKEDMKSQLIMAIKILGLLSSIPMIIIFSFGKEFYSLWAPTQDSNFLYLLTIISCINLVFALPLEPLYNIFTVTNKIKVSSIYLIISSTISIIGVFIGLQFTNNDNIKVIIIIAISSILNLIRVLTFLPIYGAKCLNLKLFTFYPTLLKNVVSIIILSGVAILFKTFVSIDTWIKLIAVCIIIAIISLIINMIINFNKQERSDFLNQLKQKLKILKEGE